MAIQISFHNKFFDGTKPRVLARHPTCFCFVNAPDFSICLQPFRRNKSLTMWQWQFLHRSAWVFASLCAKVQTYFPFFLRNCPRKKSVDETVAKESVLQYSNVFLSLFQLESDNESEQRGETAAKASFRK